LKKKNIDQITIVYPNKIQFMKKNVVILGNGLLGSELHVLTAWDVISRKDGLDFTRPDTIANVFHRTNKKYDILVNCVANTNTHSENKQEHLKVNTTAVYHLVNLCNTMNAKLVHISTDFVYANCTKSNPSENDVPVHAENWYSYSKLLGDGIIEMFSSDYLILRASHKKTPFPFDRAYSNIVGNFDYVDVIANQIYTLVSAGVSGIYNIGTDPKSFYDLAKQTNPSVIPMEIEDTIKNRTYSIEKFKNLMNDVD